MGVNREDSEPNANSVPGSSPTADHTDKPTLDSDLSGMPAEMIGGYRIIRRIGSGGMGVVYEAEQQSPRRLVALKVIQGGRYVDEHQVKLFERESQALARLKHPGIAAIYESGRTPDGQHFFAMELVRGETLETYLEKSAKRTVTPAELRERLAACEKELKAIVNIDMKQMRQDFGENSDEQFRLWAQNRARAALAKQDKEHS